MVFLKLVHTEYQVNHKTQPFWVKVVHLVPNVQTLAGHDIGTIHLAPTTTLHFNTALKTKSLFPHWIFYFYSKMRLKRTNIWWGVSGNLSEQEWWCQNDSKVVPRVYKFKISKTLTGIKKLLWKNSKIISITFFR